MKHIDLNDPRLTAYALGELTGADRDMVSALIEGNPDALREVEAIRQMAGVITDELQAEPCPAMDRSIRLKRRETSSDAQPAMPFSFWERIGLRGWIYAGAVALVVCVAAVATFRQMDGLVDTKLAEVDSGLMSIETVDLPNQNKNIKLRPIPSQLANPTRVLQSPPGLLFGVSMNEVSEDRDAFGGREYALTAVGNLGPLPPAHNTEAYTYITDNPFLTVAQNPLSTFSIDVDTASYSNMRRFLTQNTRPPVDSVRIEELINYFSYNYAPPSPTEDKPFAAHIESATCPWKPDHRLVRIGLKGKIVSQEKRPPSNLVFLIDVSGSMQDQNKLPLVQQSMRLLVEQLAENDRVAMVVYAGSSGLVLPSTTGDNKEVILQALDRLSAGGSTHGSAGIQQAYEVAVANFIKGGSNRVILCTDGDFNVGVTSQGDLQRLIEEKAKSGVFLSVLGFGMGNLKDSTMETLADKGNGNYAYIDTLNEAKKVLVEQMTGTLITIAKDVKIQVEFNPAQVNAYRLIGYENRLLAKEDFNDDTKDAGEIGAGHTVTALYEVVPAGKTVNAPGVDPLKYQRPAEQVDAKLTGSKELLTLKLRYKQPDGATSKLLEYPYTDTDRSFGKASTDFQFASAVAMFGMILRDSPHKGGATLPGVIEVAESNLGADTEGYRREFVDLAKKAVGIMMPAGQREVFMR
jgi:Ca-activated chloride channel family protein